MALSANAPVKRAIGDVGSMPAASSSTIYEGSMVGENGSGYGRALTAGDRFRGHALEKCDNSSGSNGDKNISLLSGRYALQVTLSGVGVKDVGRPVYASDDGTLTLVGAAAAAVNSYVGRVMRYVTTSTAVVEFETEAADEFGPNPNRILKSDDYTTLATDAGKIIYLGTDAKTITLIATVAGYKIRIVNSGADAAAGIAVDPNASDKFLGGCGLSAGGDGKKLTNTKTTARRGDFLELIGDGANGWNIVGKRGTWAQET